MVDVHPARDDQGRRAMTPPLVLIWSQEKGWHYGPPMRLTMTSSGRIKWVAR
jgi:hypothetical protein